MKNKLLLTLIFTLFLISMVSALDSLGTFQQNTCINISQTCATCTYVNISSISNKDNNTIIANTPMNSFGNGEWRLPTCNSTYNLGRYDVKGVGDINGVESSFAIYYDVTPNGNDFSTGTSIAYAVILFLLFLIDGIWIYIITGLRLRNDRDEETDEIVNISIQKYVKVVMIGVFYGLFLLTLNLMNSLVLSIQQITQFSGTISGIFDMLLRLAWPWTVVIIIWIGILVYRDSNFMKIIKKNFEEAQMYG